MISIVNARIFDGSEVIDANSVAIDRGVIVSIGGPAPTNSEIIDATGATLLPGLIDSHVHTSLAGLRDALTFGVTTELEMMGYWTEQTRQEAASRPDLADFRTAGFGLTAPGGHPSELMAGVRNVKFDVDQTGASTAAPPQKRRYQAPTATTPEEAIAFVGARVREGCDFIKIMIEEGSVLNHPGLPLLSSETLVAAVNEAHRFGKMAIAHTLTLEATQQAITAGVDGLAHVFLDRPHTPEIIELIAGSGAFVTPCLGLNSSIMGHSGAVFETDERVRSKLSPKWSEVLCSCFNTYPKGNLQDVFGTVLALHDAGVDILAGTDVSPIPLPHLGGLVHGASVHHELQFLVQAGLTPLQALTAATATPARRFALTDRGRIFIGARADLLLVEGDPTTNISDTLSIRGIWREGRSCSPVSSVA